LKSPQKTGRRSELIALENPKAADNFSDVIFASEDNWPGFSRWAVRVESKYAPFVGTRVD
jgi:hypothetical protein